MENIYYYVTYKLVTYRVCNNAGSVCWEDTRIILYFLILYCTAHTVWMLEVDIRR